MCILPDKNRLWTVRRGEDEAGRRTGHLGAASGLKSAKRDEA